MSALQQGAMRMPGIMNHHSSSDRSSEFPAWSNSSDRSSGGGPAWSSVSNIESYDEEYSLDFSTQDNVVPLANEVYDFEDSTEIVAAPNITTNTPTKTNTTTASTNTPYSSPLSPSQQEQTTSDTRVEVHRQSSRARSVPVVDPENLVEWKQSITTSYELQRARKRRQRRQFYTGIVIFFALGVILIVVLAVVYSIRNNNREQELLEAAAASAASAGAAPSTSTNIPGGLELLTDAPSWAPAGGPFGGGGGDNVFARTDPTLVPNDNCMGAVVIPWPPNDNHSNVGIDASSISTTTTMTAGSTYITTASDAAQPLAASVVTMTGSTVEAGMELQGLRTCGMVHINGPGVWFALEVAGGDGTTQQEQEEQQEPYRILASTCNQTQYDSQISVYSGQGGCSVENRYTDVRNLECIAGNDQQFYIPPTSASPYSSSSSSYCGNGDQSRLVFLAEPGTTYYILVHGYRSAVGNFELQLANLPLMNDHCTNATLLQWSNGTVTSVFGSTLGATSENDDTVNVGDCGSDTNTTTPLGGGGGAGVWYMLDGDTMEGNNIQISVSTKYTGFVTVELVVFQAPRSPTSDIPNVGDGGSTSPIPNFDTTQNWCASMVCIGGMTGDDAAISFDALAETTYFVLVREAASGGGSGGGDFELMVGQTRITTGRPPIHDVCPAAVSLLPIPSSFVDGQQYPRGDTTDASFDTVQSCGNLVFTTSPGVWYTIPPLPLPNGTRLPVTARVCADPQTLVTARLSVYQGGLHSTSACDALVCVDGREPLTPVGVASAMANNNHSRSSHTNNNMNNASSSFCAMDGQEPTELTWFLEPGRQYFLLVHGDGSHVGQYDLFVAYTAVPVGKDCGTSVEIHLPHDLGRSMLGFVEPLFGTGGGRPQITPSCWQNGTENGATHEAFQTGAWYQLIGTGQSLIASTCHPSTASGIQLLVFTTSPKDPTADDASVLPPKCNESGGLFCTPSTSLMSCPNGQVSTAWYAVAGQAYYLLVHDTATTGAEDDNDAGQFVLTVDQVASNVFCTGAIGPLSSSPPSTDPVSNDDPTVARSTTFGSTRRSATFYNQQELCSLSLSSSSSSSLLRNGGSSSEVSSSPSRGLWYFVEGIGTNLTASTCSEYTNFASQISVFQWKGDGLTTNTSTSSLEQVLQGCATETGSSSSLECVGSYDLLGGDDGACLVTSTITWKSTVGAVYLILVQGHSEFEFGNFGLRILQG
jgi:hypothetical protein